MPIRTLAESSTIAAKTFRTFSSGMPELIKTGFHAIDNSVGGLGRGATMIVGASTGVGKTSVIIDAAERAAALGTKPGVISLEDTEDVLGCRLLGRHSGVNSMKIRCKSFSPEEGIQLEHGQACLDKLAAKPSAPLISYEVSSPLESILKAIKDLGELGCDIVYVDYIQKIRGHHDDRRNEISRAYTLMQRAAVQADVALCVASQVKRLYEPGAIPKRSDLKESGDLENEARIILMIGKGEDGDSSQSVVGIIDKSTFGGEGTFMSWRRGPCGTLFSNTKVDNASF